MQKKGSRNPICLFLTNSEALEPIQFPGQLWENRRQRPTVGTLRGL